MLESKIMQLKTQRIGRGPDRVNQIFLCFHQYIDGSIFEHLTSVHSLVDAFFTSFFVCIRVYFRLIDWS